jgi:hypothetical protein
MAVAAVSCGARCERARPLCQHGCAAPCHPGSPCPDVVCRESVQISCACGRRVDTTMCGRGGANDRRAALQAAAAAAAKSADDDNDDPNEDDDDAAVQMALRGGTAALACNDECEAEARRQQLADAFGIAGRDGAAPLYSTELMHFALASPAFVRLVERHLLQAATSVAIGASHRLPPMDRLHRATVHKLAKYYFLRGESVGEEPQRCVVVTRQADCKHCASLCRVVSCRGVNSSACSSNANEIALRDGASQLAERHRHGVAPLFESHSKHSHHSSRSCFEALGRFVVRLLAGSLCFVTGTIADKYKIKWLDDSNALAMFVDPADARIALRQVSVKWYG